MSVTHDALLMPRTIPEYSLEYQRIATDAAQDMLFPTWIAAVFAVVASIVLILTLRETYKIGADTRRIGEAQTRGYLRIEPTQLVFGAHRKGHEDFLDGTLYVGVRVYGATPIHRLNMDFSLKEALSEQDVDSVSELRPRFYESGGQTLFPGQGSLGKKGASSEKEQQMFGLGSYGSDAISADYLRRREVGSKNPILVRCCLTWFDVFGNGFHSSLCSVKTRTTQTIVQESI